MDRLSMLVNHQGLKTDKEPHTPSGSVVVVRWDKIDYLMDGRKRINRWIRVGDLVQSSVIVVEHQNEI